jgi:hypothetical protein
LDITREIGSRDSERIYLCNLSAARIGLGQYASAEADLREVVAQAAPAGAYNLPEALSLLSEACMEQGKWADALASGMHSLELARASGNSLFTADAWRAVGRAIAAQPQTDADCVSGHQAMECPADPDECLKKSVAVYQQIGVKGEAARTLRIWAELDLKRQMPGPALQKLEEARRIFHDLGMTWEMDRADAVLSGLSRTTSATCT